jgi:hypothetical protein
MTWTFTFEDADVGPVCVEGDLALAVLHDQIIGEHTTIAFQADLECPENRNRCSLIGQVL